MNAGPSIYAVWSLVLRRGRFRVRSVPQAIRAPTANTCDTSLTTCYLELLKAPFLPRVRDWPRGAKGAQICSAVTSTVFGGKIGISMSRLERRQ